MSDYPKLIGESGLSIHDPISAESPLYIPNNELQNLLTDGLKGTNVEGLPPKTRSKVVKSAICKVLGYPVPKTFKRKRPHFLGQNFDVYTQSADNLQIWNEPVSPLRRYVIIREAGGSLGPIRVISGENLAPLDKTGKLTQKYQARLIPGDGKNVLVSKNDTVNVKAIVGAVDPAMRPIDYPVEGQVLPIGVLFKRLLPLIGSSFPDTGGGQDRNRGAALHQLVCEVLGYKEYADDGSFPDVKNQILEVKLQTRTTIDLGLVSPDSIEPVGIPAVGEIVLQHCDCRYAIFSATTDGSTVTLNQLLLTTGEAFFSRFPRFEGMVLNTKIQLPLPRDFF